jgi:hypothetical protein
MQSVICVREKKEKDEKKKIAKEKDKNNMDFIFLRFFLADSQYFIFIKHMN